MLHIYIYIYIYIYDISCLRVKKCCISNAVNEIDDDKLWNDGVVDGDVRE